MRLAIGSDHAGLDLKTAIKTLLDELKVPYEDFGTGTRAAVDYPDFAEAVATAVVEGRADLGILVCGTGIGMAITANKVPGIRAAQISDPYGAERAAKSNDAQIVTLGALTTGPETAKLLVDSYLASEFAGGRSAPKVAKIDAVDRKYREPRAKE